MAAEMDRLELKALMELSLNVLQVLKRPRDAVAMVSLEDVQNVFSKLETVPGLRDDVAAIRSTFQSKDGREKVQAKADFLHNVVYILYLNLFGGEPNAPLRECVVVKISKANDLAAVTHSLRSLQLSIEPNVVDPKIGGKMEIERWDNGSLWLRIGLGTATAVALVGSLAWAGAVIYKKKQEGSILEEKVRGLKIRNDALDALGKAQEEILKVMIEGEARHLELEFFGGDSNPERTERLKLAVVTISELIEKGTQIRPELEAPENVKNLFPDFKNLLAIESRIKQIGDAPLEGSKEASRKKETGKITKVHPPRDK